MPCPTITAVLAALLLTLPLIGCDETGTGPEDTAESAVRTLLDACAHESSAAALPVLTPPARSRLVGADSVVAGCERVLGVSVKNELVAPDVFKQTSIEGVTTEGGFGTVTIRAPSGETSHLELESEGSSWLVANPAPA